MMKLSDYEFYGTPSGDVMLSSNDHPLKVYEVADREFTQAMLEKIGEFYPEAFSSLAKHYEKSKANRGYFEYLIVHRFIRCNFNVYDSRTDVDAHGCFRFEYVPCPLRGECKLCGVVCSPSFNSKLSERELQVMKLYFHSVPEDAIADTLFISVFTVRKHKRNALERLGLHSLSEFIAFAAKNKMFEND